MRQVDEQDKIGRAAADLFLAKIDENLDSKHYSIATKTWIRMYLIDQKSSLQLDMMVMSMSTFVKLIQE